MTPELKLGALLDDTLVALRNRGRELPDYPKGSVFAEDDDTLTSAEVASAAAEATVDPFQQHGECALLAKMRTASGDVALLGNAAPQVTVKSGAQIGDRHTKKRLDSAGGGRKDRARADKRGYVPSRSKRGGGGAYGWGAAPSATELLEWEVRRDKHGGGRSARGTLGLRTTHFFHDFAVVFIGLFICLGCAQADIGSLTDDEDEDDSFEEYCASWSLDPTAASTRSDSGVLEDKYESEPVFAWARDSAGVLAWRLRPQLVLEPEHEHRCNLHAVKQELQARGDSLRFEAAERRAENAAVLGAFFMLFARKLRLPDASDTNHPISPELFAEPPNAPVAGDACHPISRELFAEPPSAPVVGASASRPIVLELFAEPPSAPAVGAFASRPIVLERFAEPPNSSGTLVRDLKLENWASIAAAPPAPAAHPAVYLPVKPAPEEAAPLLVLSKKKKTKKKPSKRVRRLSTRIRYLETQAPPATAMAKGSPSSVIIIDVPNSFFEQSTSKAMALEQIAEADVYQDDVSPTASLQRESLSAMCVLCVVRARALAPNEMRASPGEIRRLYFGMDSFAAFCR